MKQQAKERNKQTLIYNNNKEPRVLENMKFMVAFYDLSLFGS